jgi:holo-[acyl-carrier protein] synthase
MLLVGVDVVDIARFRVVMTRTPRLVERLFVPYEREYAQKAVDPTARLAVRFATKEAVMKVLGVGLGAFSFHDVSVVRLSGGRPELVIAGRALALAESAGIDTWALSLSHSDSSAISMVVAEAHRRVAGDVSFADAQPLSASARPHPTPDGVSEKPLR